MRSWREDNVELIKKGLTGKRVLVTGAAGFVGSQLTAALVSFTDQVHVVVKSSSDLWRLKNFSSKLKAHPLDLGQTSAKALTQQVGPVDIVFHLAAAGVNPLKCETTEMVHSNVVGTLNLLNFAKEIKPERFINCGSCFEYGNGHLLTERSPLAPTSEYGVSKSSAWMLCHMFQRSFGLPVVSLRPFTVYGPFEGVNRLIPYVISLALQGRDIELTSGDQTRDFVFIEDVVDAFLAAGVTSNIIGETFNLATAKETSVRDVVLTILRLTQSRSRPLFGAKPSRSLEIWQLSGNADKAKTKLGWSALTPLEEGLRKTIEHFR